MTRSRKTIQIFIISFIIIASVRLASTGQVPASEVMQTGTLKEQMDFVQNRTIIYENFRAIREDMFQTIKKNALDSLESAKSDLQDMKALMYSRNREIDSMNILIKGTMDELTLAVESRDNIVFLGIPMNKMKYNMFVWVIIGGLTILLILGLLLYNRNRIMTVKVLDEIEDLKKEFEEYKFTTREKREKLVMEHFNEIKKLKEV